MLYLSLAFYLIFLAFHYDFGGGGSRSLRMVNLWIALALLVLLSGLRYRLAPDTVAYMAQFENNVVSLNDGPWDYLVGTKNQIFWGLLNSVCKTFGSFVLLQITVASIFNGCVFYFLRRATAKLFTAILLFYLSCYFYFSMEIMRESLAVAMFLIAIVRYNDRRFIAFYGWLIAAGLFHQFAFLVVIMTPILLNRRIPEVFKTTVAVALIAFLFNLENPLGYISSLGGYLSDLNLQFYDVESRLSSLGLLYNLMRIFPIILVLLWYRDRPLSGLILRKEVTFPLCWMFVAIVVVRITSIPFMDRVSNYFVIFVIACLAPILVKFCEQIPFKSFQIFLLSSSSALILTFFLVPLLSPSPGIEEIPTYRRYYPYSSIFTMQTDQERERIIVLEAKE